MPKIFNYELTLPDGVEGEFDLEHPLLRSFAKIATSARLPQEMFTEMLHAYVEHDVAHVDDGPDIDSITAELSEEGGEAYIRDTWSKLQAALGPEAAGEIDQAISSASQIRALNQLLTGEQTMSNDGPGNQGGGLTRSELRELRFKTFPEGHRLAGKEMYGRDQDHTAQVDEAYAEMFPGEDRTEVG